MIIVLTAGLLQVACGESDENKAKSMVCDARANIENEVNTLTGLTITTASVDQVQQSLKAIGDDLKQITHARADLDPNRKQQVETVRTTAQQVVTGLAAGDAKAQFRSALADLAASYKGALSPLDCG